MFQLSRTRALTFVRTSRVAQILVACCAIFLIASLVLFANLKTVDARIDGKTVRFKTVFKTVGQALAYSNLKFYPEDIVKPSRDTLVTNGLTIDVTKSVPVQLSVDEQTFMTRTAAKTVGEALTDLSGRFGLQVKDVDEVNFPRSDLVTNQMEIKVRRAIPIVVRADGKTIDTYIAPRTVADALKKLGISLGVKDKISLALDHLLVPDDQLNIVRVAEKVETIKTPIPFQTVMVAANYPVGFPDKVVSRGSNGLQAQTVKLTLEDGKEVDREILSQEVVTPPTNQVTSRGAQTSISRGGTTINFKRAYIMRATAYCEPGGSTATGAPVHSGIIAVDPKVISLGDQVYVEGYGFAVALDTGGAIQGNRIDVYMNSVASALSWGVRTVTVYVQ